MAETVELVTIYLVDLVGSTRLAAAVGPVRADELRDEYFALLREAVDGSGGREFKNTGDGLLVAFSPLGQLARKVVTPRLRVRHRYSPGPAKRLAQGMGLAASGTALALHYGFGRRRAARVVLGGLIGAASLEAFLGVCLACRMFPYLMRAGLAPRDNCEECADIGSRRSPAQAPPVSVGDLRERTGHLGVVADQQAIR